MTHSKYSVFKTDPEIKELVTELNNEGFTTVESCAGHLDDWHTRGYIRFDFEPTEEEQKRILTILRKHNTKRPRFRFSFHGEHSKVEFTHTGGHHKGGEWSERHKYP